MIGLDYSWHLNLGIGAIIILSIIIGFVKVSYNLYKQKLSNN